MPRPVAEWVGETDASRAPTRVRERIRERHNGLCYLCGQPLDIGKSFDLDHKVALINGGANCESNLAPTHRACHLAKTAADVAEKARVASLKAKHTGAYVAPPATIKSAPQPRTAKTLNREARASTRASLPVRQLYRSAEEAVSS